MSKDPSKKTSKKKEKTVHKDCFIVVHSHRTRVLKTVVRGRRVERSRNKKRLKEQGTDLTGYGKCTREEGPKVKGGV